ncbi:MAG: hypothetical protein HYT79_11080 [Elusimicrobia bacterium]|nr:hypothetical protein [Elusimicrobiota bacterium]
MSRGRGCSGIALRSGDIQSQRRARWVHFRIDIDPDGLALYNEPGDHAVVLEGYRENGPDGGLVFLRDSNDPNAIVVLGANQVRDAYLRLTGGGLGLCPPHQRERCVTP